MRLSCDHLHALELPPAVCSRFDEIFGELDLSVFYDPTKRIEWWLAQLPEHSSLLSDLWRMGWLPVPNFGGAVLDGTELDGVDLPQALFTNVRLRNLSLTDSVLDGSRWWHSEVAGGSFRGASLRGLDGVDSTFQGVDFGTCDLRGARLYHVTFRDCRFTAAALVQGELEDCRFESCDFRDASLARSEVQRTTFARCDLTGCRLDSCGFSASRLLAARGLKGTGAIFDRVEFRGCFWA